MSSVNNNISPYHDPSFYSNWENEQIRNVDWEKLPATRALKWHEVTKIRNAVSHILMVLAVAASAAIIFTATSIACASLFIGSLAFFVTGIYLRTMEDNPLDPDFRMKERSDIKDTFRIRVPHIGILDSLVARFIITETEKQALLHQDIYGTDYDIFITKHGQIIFGELDKQNLSFLKLKFLAYLSNCEITDLTEILNSKANQYFNLTEADLALFLAIENNQEELNEQEEPSGQKEPNRSTLARFTSQLSSYMGPAVNLAANIFFPPTVKAAGQLAMASAKLAYKGETKKSVLYATHAATCLLIHSTKAMMKVLYPEASEVAQQQIMYEKALNSGKTF